jgi:hypothetical protein
MSPHGVQEHAVKGIQSERLVAAGLGLKWAVTHSDLLNGGGVGQEDDQRKS